MKHNISIDSHKQLEQIKNSRSEFIENLLAAPEHTKRHQVIAGPIVTSDGRIIQCCDAGAGSHDGTAVHISTDNGKSWKDPWDGAPMPSFNDVESGTTIAGIHAGIVELADGSLMTLGRGNTLTDGNGRRHMPMSISEDGGKTWPVKKLMTDGTERMLDGGAWTKQFIMDATHAEPRGYLAGTQSPDGMIHILSSRLHYRFNLEWILKD